MDKRIIYTNDEGVVSVIVPAPECQLTIDEIAEKDVPKGKKYHIVDISEIPSDRTYRNAWGHTKGKIHIDPVKKAAIDAKKAEHEVEELIKEKQKELARKELIKEGVLDANGKKK